MVECCNCLLGQWLFEEVDGRHLSLEGGVWGGRRRATQETLVVDLERKGVRGGGEEGRRGGGEEGGKGGGKGRKMERDSIIVK